MGSWNKHSDSKHKQGREFKPQAVATVPQPPLVTVATPPKQGHSAVKPTHSGNVRAHEAAPSATTPTAAQQFAWVPAYLESLQLSGSKMEAARAAGISPTTVMRHRNREPGFVKAEEDALRAALALVESEIRRRAVKGVMRVRYGRDGKVLSREIEYSDMLILRLAERMERGTWSQRQIMEHDGKLTFKTAAERKAALEEARRIGNRPAPVAALNGRS